MQDDSGSSTGDRINGLLEPGRNENWDLDNAVVAQGTGNRDATFSVRFRAGEIEALRGHAESLGITTGEFIRRVALAALHDTDVSPQAALRALGEYVDAVGNPVVILPKSSHLVEGKS